MVKIAPPRGHVAHHGERWELRGDAAAGEVGVMRAVTHYKIPTRAVSTMTLSEAAYVKRVATALDLGALHRRHAAPYSR